MDKKSKNMNSGISGFNLFGSSMIGNNNESMDPFMQNSIFGNMLTSNKESPKAPFLANMPSDLILFDDTKQKPGEKQEEISMPRLNKTVQKNNKIPLKIHGRDRVYRKKLQEFENLAVALTNVFKGDMIDLKDLPLDSIESKLLKTMLIKKFGGGLNKSLRFKETADELDLNRVIDICNSFDSSKRGEENNKFVYKHTLKYLKAQYYDEKNLRYNKKSEEQFYLSYFGKEAEKTGNPIEAFYDPLNIQLKNSKTSKTISNDHLKLVFGCKTFKAKFFDYIGNSFKEDYQSSIYKKIEKILLKLEKQIKQNKNKSRDEVINAYVNDIRNKKRVKFPWSSKEIDSATAHFSKHINKLQIESGS